MAQPAWTQVEGEILDAAEMLDQLEMEDAGDYGELLRRPSVPLGEVQRAWDRSAETDGLYRVGYSPDRIIKIRVRRLMTTTIVFPEWEEIGDIYLGDPHVFRAERTKPHVVVVDTQFAGADTSLTLTGEASGNVYAFYLRAEDIASKTVPDVVVRVAADPPVKHRRLALMTGDEVNGAEAIPAVLNGETQSLLPDRETGLNDPDFAEEIPVDLSKVSFKFSMAGDSSIAPERVFSDGLFTYLDFGERWDASDLPAVYRVVDEVDTPVNVRYSGHMIVVEATGSLTLRNGFRYVCVWETGSRPAVRTAGRLGDIESWFDLGDRGVWRRGRREAGR